MKIREIIYVLSRLDPEQDIDMKFQVYAGYDVSNVPVMWFHHPGGSSILGCRDSRSPFYKGDFQPNLNRLVKSWELSHAQSVVDE